VSDAGFQDRERDGNVGVLDDQVIDLRDAPSVIDLREAPLVVPVRPDPWWRRPFDVAVALTALIILAPVLVFLVAVIALTSGFPVCHAQTRLGRGGQTFRCLKFRSMVKNAPLVLERLLASDAEMRREYAAGFKLRNDPRVTTIGKIIRRTSLDELPQLWNVVRGDLSLVGPRPIVRDELALYGEHAATLLSVRPGLTGLWQVSGRNSLPYAERVRLDVDYIEHRSIRLDVRILFRTVLQMALPFRNGAC
jgi:lipopolysaccharide/colanic/teichoic acid biosynthesis glycosyltransferase